MILCSEQLYDLKNDPIKIYSKNSYIDVQNLAMKSALITFPLYVYLFFNFILDSKNQASTLHRCTVYLCTVYISV